MDTYFAPPGRSATADLKDDITLISCNTIIDTLLSTSAGLFAILNQDRQLIAVNQSFLQSMGITDTKQIIGYRLGEIIKCDYADSYPNGCGTTLHCTTCGAAIAIASTIRSKESYESNCVVKRDNMGVNSDLMFHIKSSYIEISGRAFILLFLRDISREQELGALERVFFHDINNILTSINVATELIPRQNDTDKLLKTIRRGCLRMRKELEMQECLSQTLQGDYHLHLEITSISDLLSELQNLIRIHTSCDGKVFSIPTPEVNFDVYTDISIVMRVLTNMSINALEATEFGGKVTLWYTHPTPGTLTFHIQNNAYIPPEDTKRIFQKNFSTKSNTGRGLGTYSMKLFGESILGGKVDFTTSETEGTVFTFTIPIQKYEI